MKNKLFTVEREYLLMHEILQTLRRKGMTIVQHGSESEGHVPIDKLVVPTAKMPYGNLVALLNGKEIQKSGASIFAKDTVKREEVEITKYDWPEVNSAIQVLDMNGHVDDEVDNDFVDVQRRTIKLTESGLKAFNTRFYLKEGEKEQLTKQLHDSTISTNVNTRAAMWASFFVSVAALGISLFTLLKNEAPYKSELQQLIQEMRQFRQMQSKDRMKESPALNPASTNRKNAKDSIK